MAQVADNLQRIYNQLLDMADMIEVELEKMKNPQGTPNLQAETSSLDSPYPSEQQSGVQGMPGDMSGGKKRRKAAPKAAPKPAAKAAPKKKK